MSVRSLSATTLARRAALLPLTALLATAAAAAHAEDRNIEPYVGVGFPVGVVGLAFPLHERVTLRADYGTAGHHSYNGTSSDNDYKGTLKYDRFGAFADFFVVSGLRVTAGLVSTSGDMTLKATSKGSTISIGGTVYHYTGDVYSDITLPSTSPYLGIGWGHQLGAGGGLSFHADLGAAIGKAKATDLKAEGDVAQFVSASDLADENKSFQDNVAKIKAIPQLTLGLSYRF